MAIAKEQIQVTKYLSGFFYDRDLKYEQIKWDYLNEVVSILGITSSYQNFKLGAVDVLKIPQRMNEFEFRICDQNFNYEDSQNATPKEVFVDNSLKLAKLWQQYFKKPIKKAGGVINFKIINYSDQPVKFIRKYFQPIPMGINQKSGRFHLNYEELIRDERYNINLNMLAENPTNLIAGSIDINRRADNLKEVDFKEIFEVLFEYYDKKIVELLNYKEEQ